MTLTMSMMFRLIGSVTKSVSQALAPASIILLGIALYTGFAIPPNEMQPWIGWIRWLNPVFYGLESLFVNEFVGRNFTCSTFIPTGFGYESVGVDERVCNTVGSVPGQDFVSGTEYLRISYGFVNSHRWRNFGVLIAFIVLFMGLHLLATEYIASERSKGEVLVFTRNGLKRPRKRSNDAEEVGDNRPTQPVSDDSANVTDIKKQASVFHWKDVCYEVKIKAETRQILNRVDGWVKPGTLTALMVRIKLREMD
jgi:ATP-binding cassette subfamily G (WHITE) protein 2 (PDR)